MSKAILTFAVLFISAGGALAQGLAQRGTPQDEKACRSDVSRHCRRVMQEGDMVILQCLKEHRRQLSRACRQVLEQNGQ
jgi:hypothetical protein